MLLDHPRSLPSPSDKLHHGRADELTSAESTAILHTALKMALNFTDAFVAEVCDLISPFLLHLMYKLASVYMDRSVDDSSRQAKERIDLLRKSLALLKQRWLVADAYVSLLERREVLLMLR